MAAGRLHGVPWTNKIGVTDFGRGLVKIAGANATWDAGADTRDTASADGDCYVEWRASHRLINVGQAGMIGLSRTGTSAGFADIQFAIYQNADHFLAYEDGVGLFDAGANSVDEGDVLRIERVGTAITYKRNGTTLYTSVAANRSGTLYVDASFFNIYSRFDDVVFWIGDTDSAMVALLKRGVSRLNMLLAVAFHGVFYRYGTAGSGGAASATEGLFRPRVVEWGPIHRAVSLVSCSLQYPETYVVIEDFDREFQTLAAKGKLHFSPAIITVASPDLTKAQWQPLFTGKLSGYEQVGPFRWRLNFTGNDLSLRSTIGRDVVDRATAPNASQDAVGLPYPITYGRHMSHGIGEADEGMCKAPNISKWNATYAYYMIGQAVTTLTMVYRAKVSQGTGGLWSAQYPTLGARLLGVIKWLSGDPGDDEFTFDMHGYDILNTGFGDYYQLSHGRWVEQCVDVLRHLYVNFVANRFLSGSFLEDDLNLIDLLSFADVKRLLLDHGAARYIDDKSTGEAEVNAWCESFQVMPYFTRAGKLAIGMEDPFTPAGDLYDARWLRWDLAPTDEALPPLLPKFEGDAVAKRVTASYCHSNALGRFVGTTEVADEHTTADESRDSIECLYSPSLIHRPPDAVRVAGVNLAGWWNADTLLSLDHDAQVATWHDASGNGRHLTQATAGKRPLLKKTGQPFPFVRFDTTDDELGGAGNLSLFATATAFTWYLVFRVNDATVVDSDVLMGDTGSYVRLRLRYSAPNAYLELTHFDVGVDAVTTPLGSVIPGQWYAACFLHTGGQIFIGLNDARALQMSVIASGNTGALGNPLKLSGLAGFPGLDVAQAICFDGDIGEERVSVMSYLLGKYIHRTLPSQETAKNAASRRLVANRQPRLKLEGIAAPPEFAVAVDMLDLVNVSHPNGPNASGGGWGREKWARRNMVVVGHTTYPNVFAGLSDGPACELDLIDHQPAAVTYYDSGTAKALDTGEGALELRDGVAILGATRGRCTRSGQFSFVATNYGYAWVADENSYIRKIWPNAEKRTMGGLLVESWHGNYLNRGTNALGVGSIAPGSLNGTGVNGSAIADENPASGSYLDPTLYPQCYKLTAGNPHTADLYIRFPTTPVIPWLGAYLWLMMDIWAPAVSGADRLNYRLRYDPGGGAQRYYNAGTTVWQLGTVWNPITVGAANVWQTFREPQIQPEVANYTFSLDVGLPSGGTASRIARLYSAQLDENNVGHLSRVLNDSGSAEAVQPSDFFVIPNDYGKMLSMVRGTVLLRLKFAYDSAVVAIEPTVLNSATASGTTFRLDGNAGTWRFTYGATSTSVAGATFSRDDRQSLAIRWTSSETELGLPANTMHVFAGAHGVAMTKSAAAVFSGVGDSLLRSILMGSDTTDGSQTGIAFMEMVFCPRVLSDEEIQAWATA